MSDISIAARPEVTATRTTFAPARPVASQPVEADSHFEQPVDTFEPSAALGDDYFASMSLLSGGEADETGAEKCQSGFEYDPVALPDLGEAKEWRPGSDKLPGADANAHINDTYDKLDKDMTRYLGQPTVANWMTFGKYASREAGEQIRNLENVERLRSGDIDAGLVAARDMANAGAMNQGLRLVKDTASRDDASGTITDKLSVMRDALVEGNTDIYGNIAPAYDAFLRGEADPAKGGMQALKEAGYEKGSEKDPQGFVTAAFQKYAEARQKGIEAEQASDPAERQRLLNERTQRMNEGNLQIGLQEQMTILQRDSIYGDPNMKEALQAIGGTMSLTDANGTHALRPDGASWAGFAERMGFARTTADDPNGIAVADHQGRKTSYVPDNTQTGTIYEYFTKNVEGDAARNLIESAPRPL